VTFTFNQLTQKLIEIIYGSWPSKIPMMVPLSLIGYKLLSGQVFKLSFIVTLIPKINRDHLRVMAIYDTKKDLPSWNKFEVNERTPLC